MVESSPAPPARTHSSTSESLKRKRRPTLWAGSRFLSTHRYTESLFTPRWVATSSTLTQRSSAVILVLPRWAMARNSDLNQRKPTKVYEVRQALQEGTGRNSGLALIFSEAKDFAVLGEKSVNGEWGMYRAWRTTDRGGGVGAVRVEEACERRASAGSARNDSPMWPLKTCLGGVFVLSGPFPKPKSPFTKD